MNSSQRAEHLLQEHSLRATPSRVRALKLFLDKQHAISQPDLEKSLGEEFDRVTLYRTLTSFMEKGLIHKVPDDEGAARYAICSHDAVSGEHSDEHIHFKCTKCGNTNCLDELPFPHFREPKGYSFTETNILIQGICKTCNAKA